MSTKFILNPDLPRAKTDHATVTMQAGRFELRLDLNRRVPTGGISWSLVDPDAVRFGDKVPTEGHIVWSALAAEQLIHVVNEFVRYSEFLAVQEEIERDPERYAALAAAELEAEEAAAEAERKAQEKAAKAEASAAAKAEQERLKAEQAEQDAAEQARLAAEQAKKQARLDALLHRAAARELGAA